jgi:plasmid stabilization system protein ParE
VSGRSSARSHRFHPHAGNEYLEDIEYLRADDRQVAVDFTAAVDEAIARVIEYPEIGVVILERRGRRIRKWRVQGFRYSLIYAVLDDVIRILAVAHHSRRPGYWLYRLRTL